jgi:membrane-associated phospholipid phosphatase
MTLRRIVWAAALAGAGAAIGHAALRTQDGRELDENLFKAANAQRSEAADRVFGAMTEAGSLYAVGAAAVAHAVLGRPRGRGRRRGGARAGGGPATTWLVLQGIKRVVARPRPFTADPEATRRLIAAPHGTSWPSSHPAVITTFGRIAARELGIGAGGRTLLTALDLAVATSRVTLGVHYPSDVASGLLFGRAFARLWPRRRRAALGRSKRRG